MWPMTSREPKCGNSGTLVDQQSFFTRDSIYAIARICYRPSVRHTDGSYKNG